MEIAELQHRVKTIEQQMLAQNKRADDKINRLIAIVEKLLARIEVLERRPF